VKPILALAAMTATAILAAGCGDETGSGTSSPSATATPTATPTPTSTPTSAEAFPLTVSRSGGFAGFDDKLVIEAGGATTVTSRKTTTRCTVDPKLLATIASGAAQVDWSALPAVPPKIEHPDDMVMAVKAARGGVAELGDPRLKALSTPLSQLLTDAGNPAGQRKLCR
jgi:hypothetical protein